MKTGAPSLTVASSLLMMVFAALPAVAEETIVPQHVMQRALGAGSARVIVRLNMMYSPAAETAGDIHAAAQRNDIAAARSAVKSRLLGRPHTIVREYDTLPFVTLEAGPDALRELESMAGLVTSVEEDRIHRPQLAQSVPVVQAPPAWSRGFDGTGTIVALLDAGVQKTHPFLTGKVIAEACFSSNTTSSGFTVTSLCPGGASSATGVDSGLNCPADIEGCDHGTHVAGIIAGGTTGVSGSGVAPGARIMSIQVFSRFPGAHPLCDGVTDCVLSYTSDQLAALNHVFNRRNAFAGRRFASINMSLGSGVFVEPCAGLQYETPIAMLKTAGIATVVASGNDGFTDAISAPACVPGAVSVGSTGDGSLGATLNALSEFSNSASFLSLLAPGQWINSSIPTTTSSPRFANFAGTSMSTPHVAAAFAILRGANSTASVDTLLQALRSTGLAVTDTRPPCPGCASSGEITPRININAAVNAVTRPDLSVTAATTVAAASPGQSVAVNHTVSNRGVDAGAFTVAFYLSTNDTFDAADMLLLTRGVSSLTAGGVSQATTTMTIPPNTAPGIYRIIVRVDPGAAIQEGNEGNNARATAPVVIGRDVSVTAATTVAVAMPGQAIVVDNTVTNSGSVAVGSFLVRFYLSVNTTFSTDDVLLGGRTVGSLPAGELSRATSSVTIPANVVPGTYRILVRADAGGQLTEVDESNNVRATAPIGIGCSAGTITVGTTVNGNLATSDCRSPIRGSSFYADRYSFSGSAGQQVAVLLRSTAFDTYLHLVRPSGSVTADDDGGGGVTGRDSRIPANAGLVTLPTTGTYIVEVTSFNADATGAYTLTLTTVGGCTLTPITAGSTATGGLTASDCQSPIRGSGFFADRYSFSGTAGQQVAILLQSSVFDTYLNLVRPGGSVTSDDDSGGGPNGTNSRIPAGTGLFTLPATGTYIIEVTSFFRDTTGAYTLSLTTAVACTVAPITRGSPRAGALTTSDCRSPILGSGFFADRYSFSGTAGQQVAILLQSSDFDTFLNLVRPGGSVSSDDDGGGGPNGTNSRIPAGTGLFTLPATGTYIIEVTSFFSGNTGGYTLSLTANTAPDCAVSPIAVGSTRTGALTTSGCRSSIRGGGFFAARYSFSGTGGQQVAILLQSSAFDTFLNLVRPGGSVTSDDDSGGGTNGTNSRIPAGPGLVTLPATGTYIIEVTSFDPDTTGAFTLSLTTGASTGSCTIAPITVGATRTGALATTDCRSPIDGSGFFADRYSFSGSAGQRVSVLLRSTAFDAFLNLVSPGGVVTFDSNGGGGRNGTDARLPATAGFITLPATGTYIVEVTTSVANTTGAYSLTLGAGTACPVTALTVGSTRTGALATTDCRSAIDGSTFFADRYSFTGMAGQQVAVLLRSTTIDAYVHLISPNGTVTSNDDGGGGTDSRIPAISGVVTLPVSGTYQVEVTSFDPNDTGAYTLTVSPTAASATAIAPPSSSKVRRTPAAAPDLTVTAASTVAASPPGRSIAVNYTVTNGRVALTGFKIGFYLSRDSIFDVNDVQIASRTVTSLAAGGEVRGPTSATIPANTAPGTYRVLVRADSEGVLVEPSEADNVRATGAIVIGPDLTVTAATATVSSVARGLTIDIDHTVKNTGAVAGAFTVRFYLSTNDTYSRTSDTLLPLLPTPSSQPATGRTVSSLAAGAVNRTTTRLKIPMETSPGPYRILVRVDAGGSGSAGVIVEASETNNVRATGVITVNP